MGKTKDDIEDTNDTDGENDVEDVSVDEAPKVKKVETASLKVETLDKESEWVKEQIADLRSQMSQIQEQLAAKDKKTSKFLRRRRTPKR